MNDLQLGAIESRFADIIWDREKITAAELAREGFALLGWKKTTCYTVLKRLCAKGLFKTEDGMVTVLIPRDEYYAAQSRRFVEESFEGSLPAFIAAFTNGRPLSDEEADYLRALIEEKR